MRTAAALGLMLAAAVAGCGDAVVDHRSIERALTPAVARRGHAGVRLRCPDVSYEVGRRFECRATGGGARLVQAQLARHARVRLLGVAP